jgi:tetratricopeptide (TPR) repeat protein
VVKLPDNKDLNHSPSPADKRKPMRGSTKNPSAPPQEIKPEPVSADRAAHPLDRAIAELRAESARRPDDPSLYGRLGALCYRRGYLEEAATMYRRAVELDPNRPGFQNNLGNVLCDLGRLREGVSCYERALNLEKSADPSGQASPTAEVNLELAKLELRLIHERIEYLERAAALEVSSAGAYNALGCGYLLRGRKAGALGAFREALKHNPREAAAAINIAFTHTLALDDFIEPQTAVAECAALAERFPRSARLWLHQGEILEASGFFDEAAERYLRTIRADPYRLEAYDMLGRLGGVMGLEEEIEEEAEAILARLESGRRGSRAGQSERTYACAFAAAARAKLLREPAPTPESAADLSRLAEDADQNSADAEWAVRAVLLRSRLLEAAGRTTEAETVLSEAERRFPKDRRFWFEHGRLAFRIGAIEVALGAFEQAALAAPGEAYVHHSLRFAFEGWRRWRTECVRFETAVATNPNDPTAYHHLGLAALSVMRSEEALRLFTRAWELDPKLADAACGRGRALQRLKRIAEAQAAYHDALRVDPQHAAAREALTSLTDGEDL